MSNKRRFTINFIITLTEINCKCVSIYKIIKNLSNFKIEVHQEIWMKLAISIQKSNDEWVTISIE